MLKPLHFIFSGSQSFVGGGTTAWRNLLSNINIENKIYLHYSSYASELWRDFSNHNVVHVIHHGWKTWDNRNYVHYDNSNQNFDFKKIADHSKVIFDSIECVKQLTIRLARKNCELYWRVNSPEHCLRKDLIRMVKDLYRIQKIKKLIFISDYVADVFKKDPVYKLFSKRIDSAIVKNGTNVHHQLIKAQSDYILYFGRFEKYKNPLFLEKLNQEVRYIGTTKGCNQPVKVPQSKYLGWMKPSEAAKYGDIFVFPALKEAFGFAVIEMMSYGKIPICFNSGAFPEIIDNGVNGYLIKPFNTDSVNSIINKIKKDHNLKKFLQDNAVKKAVNFSIENFRDQFLKEIL